MKAWGSGGVAPPFLTSALDGGECSHGLPMNITVVWGVAPFILVYSYLM
jgi:hypothetical protein